jgi:hypothetical protein
MKAHIPAQSTQELAKLCGQLVPGGAPVVLARLAPVEARPLDCFETVEQRVADRAGAPCYGWALWEWPGLFLEAEFYAVWRDPEGKLNDITPRPGDSRSILFLTDPQRVFDGRRVKTVRHAISRDPAVAGFLRACDEEFALINRGARAFMRNVALQGAELGELQQIWQRKMAFSQRLALLESSGI